MVFHSRNLSRKRYRRQNTLMTSACYTWYIPGEKDDQTVYERAKILVQKAMSTGVAVFDSNPPSQSQSRKIDAILVEDNIEKAPEIPATTTLFHESQHNPLPSHGPADIQSETVEVSEAIIISVSKKSMI
ncbi:hypothetical protein COOONC_01790 [Cooperia oncophora]